MRRHSLAGVFLVSSLLSGCGGAKAPVARATPAADGPVRPTPAPLAAPRAPAPAEPTESGKTLRFVEDDYARARAEAEKRGLPLFVDVWADWCHTCMSLKEIVFPDPRLAKLADRFVWLSIDSEKDENAAFLSRFPNRSLPTLWVLDPKTEAPVLKWIGAATADELAVVLTEASRADPGGGDAAALFVQANRASAAGKAQEAIAHYQRALSSGGSAFTARPRALEALTMRFAETGRARECVDLAVREAPGMPGGTSRVNVVVNGIDAAVALGRSAKAEQALLFLGGLARRIAEDPSEPILVDDRSSLYEALVHLTASTDPAESRRLATAWARLLEAQAAKDTTPGARRARDPHRLEAYLALGEPGRALPMLERSEREAPEDENPPARLARAHFALGDLDAAKSDIERALSRSTGPRKLRFYLLEADILLAKKDVPGARAALQGALDFARASHLASQYDKLREAIEQRLHALPAR